MEIFVKCIGAFVIVATLIFFIMTVVGLVIRDVIRPKDGPLKNYVNFVDGMDEGFSVHKLRHTAATLMYQQGGVDTRVLKDILGHENLGTTEIYTHLSNAQVKTAIESNPLAHVISHRKKSP